MMVRYTRVGSSVRRSMLWHLGSGADSAPTAPTDTQLIDVGGAGRTVGVYAAQQEDPSADLALLVSGSGQYAKTMSPLSPVAAG